MFLGDLGVSIADFTELYSGALWLKDQGIQLQSIPRSIVPMITTGEYWYVAWVNSKYEKAGIRGRTPEMLQEQMKLKRIHAEFMEAVWRSNTGFAVDSAAETVLSHVQLVQDRGPSMSQTQIAEYQSKAQTALQAGMTALTKAKEILREFKAIAEAPPILPAGFKQISIVDLITPTALIATERRAAAQIQQAQVQAIQTKTYTQSLVQAQAAGVFAPPPLPTATQPIPGTTTPPTVVPTQSVSLAKVAAAEGAGTISIGGQEIGMGTLALVGGGLVLLLLMR